MKLPQSSHSKTFPIPGTKKTRAARVSFPLRSRGETPVRGLRPGSAWRLGKDFPPSHNRGRRGFLPRSVPGVKPRCAACVQAQPGGRSLAPCVYHCNTRGQVYKALNQSFLFLRNLPSSCGETLPISPMDSATECLMGFHSMFPNTAISMARPKLNTKKGKVKE